MTNWKREMTALKWWLISASIFGILLILRWILQLNEIVFMPLYTIHQLSLVLYAIGFLFTLSYIIYRLFHFIPSLIITSVFAAVSIGFLAAVEFGLSQNGWFILLAFPWMIFSAIPLSSFYRKWWLYSFLGFILTFFTIRIVSSTILSFLVIELILASLIFGMTIALPYDQKKTILGIESVIILALPMTIVVGYAITTSMPWVLLESNFQSDEIIAPTDEEWLVVQVLRPCELCANVSTSIYQPVGLGFYQLSGSREGMHFLSIQPDEVTWVDTSSTTYRLTIDSIEMTVYLPH